MSDLLSLIPAEKPAEAPASLSAVSAPPAPEKASTPARKALPPVWAATYATGHVLTFYATDMKAAKEHADYFGGRYGIGAAGPIVPAAGEPVGILPWIGAIDPAPKVIIQEAKPAPKVEAVASSGPPVAAAAPVVSSMPVEG